MNRRIFTTTALLGLAVATALPQAGLAQSHPLIGTWKVNLAKSKYSPGPPPRSNTAIWEAVGQGFRTRTEGIDAQGNPTKTDAGVFSFDGKSYPYTGNAAYDASSYKQIGITEKVMRAPHLSQMLPSPAMKSRRRLKASSCTAYVKTGEPTMPRCSNSLCQPRIVLSFNKNAAATSSQLHPSSSHTKAFARREGKEFLPTQSGYKQFRPL